MSVKDEYVHHRFSRRAQRYNWGGVRGQEEPEIAGVFWGMGVSESYIL